jgi:hypothetical protein
MFKRLHRQGTARRPARGSTSLPGSGMQVCVACRADYVHPVQWDPVDDDRWWMLLRCGECHATREVTVPDDLAKRFGDDLDAALEVIGQAARELDGERMAGEVEAFAQALERDLIDAGDFAPRVGR